MPFMGSSVDRTWLKEELASLERLIGTLHTNMQREKGMEKTQNSTSKNFGVISIVYQICN